MDTCRSCGTVLPTGEVGGPYCPNCGALVRDHTLAVSQPSYPAEAQAPTQAFAGVPVEGYAQSPYGMEPQGDAAYAEPVPGEAATRAFTVAQPVPAPRQAAIGEEYDSFFRPDDGQPGAGMTRVMAPVEQPAAFGSEIPQQQPPQYGGFGPGAQPAYDQPIDYQAQPGPYQEPYAGEYPGQYAEPGATARSSRSAKIGIAAAAVAILVIVISLISLGGGGKGTPAAAPSNGATTDVTAQPAVPGAGADTTAPTTGASSSSSAPHIPGALQLGDSGTEVKWLQTRLHQLGLYNGPISGKFDQATQAAVAAFQARSHASDPSGVVGRSTKTALIAWGSRPRLALAGPFGGGDKHAKVNPDDVKRLQRALATALNQDVKASGVYDPATFAAVAAYQGSVGLPPDGVAGNAVWADLQSGKLPG